MERNKNSICYMSLADAFMTRLKKETELRTRSRMLKGVNVEVLPVTMDRHDFMYDYLTNLYNKKKGTFNKPKIFAKATIYECERSNPCKGNSTGDPTKTRANGCSAYVSFVFEEGATITACVIRSRLLHTGHDPTNRDESKISRIDASLRFMIEMHINNGMKISKIMTEIAKWNKLHKNTDHHNRRYFPTRQDIQQLAMSMKKPIKPLSGIKYKVPGKPRKYDTSNKDNVTRLLRTELRESCVYHQSRTTTGPNPRPLIVVIQNAEMREMLKLHGRHLIFVEKNYEGLRQYGNAVYVLVAREQNGRGGPVAYIVTSDDSAVSFVQGLQKLSTRCQVAPKAFFLEREIHGFSEVMSVAFPKSQFLTSWCQVMQDIHQWLQTSQVCGKEHADIRRVLMHTLLELKAHDTEGWFLLMTDEIQQRIEYDQFLSMLHADWLSCAAKWSDFGRIGICGSQESGSAMEMFFLQLYHQLLKGLHTKTCLEDLLRLIIDNMNEYKKCEGLLRTPHSEDAEQEQAEALMRQGWGQVVSWQGKWVALIPCHTMPDTSYRVSLITMECECPKLASEGPCLHLCLALALAQGRDGATPDQERHRLASEAYENSDYLMDGTLCLTFHSGGMCVSEIGCGKCTCVADVFGVECVGKILLKIAEGAEEAVTYTVPDPITEFSTMLDTDAANGKGEDGVFCMPLKSDKSSSSITITVTSEEGIVKELEDSVKDAPKPIVIQTCTGLDSNPVAVPDVSLRIATGEEDLETSTSSREPVDSARMSKSSQALIEELYHWSKSNRFSDSKYLQELLMEAQTLALGSKYTPSSRETNLKAAVKKPKLVGNKKLRAVVRAVKRERRVSEEEETGQECEMPTLKISRSGRTIKIKEEPDYVM